MGYTCLCPINISASLFASCYGETFKHWDIHVYLHPSNRLITLSEAPPSPKPQPQGAMTPASVRNFAALHSRKIELGYQPPDCPLRIDRCGLRPYLSLAPPRKHGTAGRTILLPRYHMHAALWQTRILTYLVISVFDGFAVFHARSRKQLFSELD